jgi:hypothetical protein
LINLEHDPATLKAITGSIKDAMVVIEKIYTVSQSAVRILSDLLIFP